MRRLVTIAKWLVCCVVSVITGICLGASSMAVYYRYAAPLLGVAVAPMSAPAMAAAPDEGPDAPSGQVAQRDGWLTAKRAHTLVAPDAAGGVVTLRSASLAPHPSAAVLDFTTVQQTLEPGGSGTDDAGQTYVDDNLFDLCGPAAAANTLAFWQYDIARWGRHAYIDPAAGVTTIWGDGHNRAYVLHLAWEIQVPSAGHAGMMDPFHDPSYGVTLYGMRDGLNWEASGEKKVAWQSYFYVNEWWDQNTPETLHADIVDDIASSGKPVVAEVNARLLTNWPSEGSKKNHYITIIGYDDTAREYTYTDTCGHSTGCGALSDAGIHTIGYVRLWEAISSIPVNTSTDPHAGDGGWVW